MMEISPMSALKGKYRKGVLYPLQTFTKGRQLRYDEIPFFVEAEYPEDVENLRSLAYRISNDVHVLDFAKRMEIQMCGVWASNFVNYMYKVSGDICEKNGVPFDVLLPLIKETANKVEEMSPYDAQTGPARRGNETIINRHLDLLEDDSKLYDIYQTITNAIKLEYDKNA